MEKNTVSKTACSVNWFNLTYKFCKYLMLRWHLYFFNKYSLVWHSAKKTLSSFYGSDCLQHAFSSCNSILSLRNFSRASEYRIDPNKFTSHLRFNCTRVWMILLWASWGNGAELPGWSWMKIISNTPSDFSRSHKDHATIQQAFQRKRLEDGISICQRCFAVSPRFQGTRRILLKHCDCWTQQYLRPAATRRDKLIGFRKRHSL